MHVLRTFVDGYHHVRDHSRVIDRVGAADIDQVQRVERIPATHGTEWIEDAYVLAQLAATARRYRSVLRLHVHDES